MYKLEFTLKQHTPIIHFQHDQDGATLRATEVKPKLDRFLRDNSDRLDYQFYDEHDSYSYSLRIINSKSDTVFEGIENFSAGGSHSIPLVLANMGKEDEAKSKFSWVDSDVKIIIRAANKKLLSDIQFLFPEFLLYTNFGNRNSKGFGSFYLSEKCKHYVDFEEFDESFFFDVNIKSSVSTLDNFRTLFKAINTFHKAIRSGIQEGYYDRNTQKFKTTFYFKSVLWLYGKTFGIQWDKRTVKTRLLDLKSDNEESNKESLIIKELLGLSTLEKWSTVKERDSSEVIFKNIDIKREHDVTLENAKIERIPSPLIYKPIRIESEIIRVYLFPKDLPKDLTNQNIKVSVSKPIPKSISLPLATEEFSVKRYFNFMFKPKPSGEYIFDIQNLVDETFLQSKTNHETLFLLEDIFNQVRKNANK
jgi:hypothetical protein